MDQKIYDQMREHEKAYQFELAAKLPISWRFQSDNLKHAAHRLYKIYHDAVLRDIDRLLKLPKGGSANDSRVIEGEELENSKDGQLIGVYFLLMGYSIENLLKGILLIDNPAYFKAKGRMKAIQSHDLVALCKACKISLQDPEAELLQKLTTYVLWQGKYPIPLESDKMWPKRQPDGSWKSRGEPFDGMETQQQMDDLHAKIESELIRRTQP